MSTDAGTPTPFKWENVSIRVDRWKRLQALCEELEPHEHCDGMNECNVCDEPLTDTLIRHCEALLTLRTAHEAAQAESAQEPVARYAGVDMSRYTIEWLIEPNTEGMQPFEKLRALAYTERVPIGTLFYTTPVAGLAGQREPVIKVSDVRALLDAGKVAGKDYLYFFKPSEIDAWMRAATVAKPKGEY